MKGATMWNIHNLHERLDELGEAPRKDYGKIKQTITADMRRMIELKNRRFHG